MANLRDLIGKLIANQKIIELVKVMEPMDMIAVISDDLDLCSSDATNVVANLLMHVNRMNSEGLSGGSIETNMQYPVPSKIKRDNESGEEIDEDFINNLGSLSPTMVKYQFPHDQRDQDQDWPYSDATIAYMDPKNKRGKRGLTSNKKNNGKVVKEKNKLKSPFNPNLKLGQPGGDYGGSQGIYSRSSPHADNPTSSSGTSYDAKGKPGWSSSPSGKGYDLPDDMPDEIDGPNPVGTSIPQFMNGSSVQRRLGFRRR